MKLSESNDSEEASPASAWTRQKRQRSKQLNLKPPQYARDVATADDYVNDCFDVRDHKQDLEEELSETVALKQATEQKYKDIAENLERKEDEYLALRYKDDIDGYRGLLSVQPDEMQLRKVEGEMFKLREEADETRRDLATLIHNQYAIAMAKRWTTKLWSKQGRWKTN